ncbi:hypothetical protein EVAR_73880_1, partial [Eumeta japonica]
MFDQPEARKPRTAAAVPQRVAASSHLSTNIEVSDVNVAEDEEMHLMVATLLLKHMGQLVCNGHAVMSLCDVNNEGIKTVAEKEM